MLELRQDVTLQVSARETRENLQAPKRAVQVRVVQRVVRPMGRAADAPLHEREDPRLQGVREVLQVAERASAAPIDSREENTDSDRAKRNRKLSVPQRLRAVPSLSGPERSETADG